MPHPARTLRPPQHQSDLYTLSLGISSIDWSIDEPVRFPLALTESHFLSNFCKLVVPASPQCNERELALSGMMVVFLYAVHLALGTFYPILGSKPLAVAINREFRAGDTIVIDGTHSQASSINFYTGRQLHMLNARTDNLWYGSLFRTRRRL